MANSLNQHLINVIGGLKEGKENIAPSFDLHKKKSWVSPENPEVTREFLEQIAFQVNEGYASAEETRDAVILGKTLYLYTELEHVRTEGEKERIEAAMSFRDKFLWGFLGDREKRKQHRELSKKSNSLKENFDQTIRYCKHFDKSLETVLAGLIAESNPDFKVVLEQYWNLRKTETHLKNTLILVINAIGHCQDSKGMEYMDLFRRNVLTSLTSFGSQLILEESIEKVKRSLQGLENLLTECQSLSSKMDGNVWVMSGGLDFIFDLFDGLGIFSLMTLSRLDDAENELWKLKKALENLSEDIKTNRRTCQKIIQKETGIIRERVGLQRIFGCLDL